LSARPTRTRRLLAGALATALGAGVAAVAAAPAAQAVAPPGSTVFVNEIHYDNAGTDAGELIEIANPNGVDLTGWSVVLYNGSGGAVYDTDPLSGSAELTVVNYPSNGIQNGSPDAIAW